MLYLSPSEWNGLLDYPPQDKYFPAALHLQVLMLMRHRDTFLYIEAHPFRHVCSGKNHSCGLCRGHTPDKSFRMDRRGSSFYSLYIAYCVLLTGCPYLSAVQAHPEGRRLHNEALHTFCTQDNK